MVLAHMVKAKQGCHCICIRMIKFKKIAEDCCGCGILVKMWSNWNSRKLLVEVQNGTSYPAK